MRLPFLTLPTLLLWGCGALPAQVGAPGQPKPEVRRFGTPKVVGAIRDSDVKESSGVAASRLNAEWFYTHNDSGGKAVVYRFSLKGSVLDQIKVPGATNVDWEDMAAAKVAGKAFVYVGDIGDNQKNRKSVVVYRFEEPGKNGKVKGADRLELTYPDGAHDAEVLMVHPVTGRIYIVEKAAGRPSKVFRGTPPERGSGSVSLKAIGQIQVGGDFAEGQMTTAGDISPDGRHVIVRTYLGAYEFTPGRNFDDWPNTKPRRVLTGLEAQGEAICYAADGRSLYTTSEGSPCPITRIPLL